MRLDVTALVGMGILIAASGAARAQEGAGTVPIRVGFLWHMHQPIYYPYVPVTSSDPFFSFSVVDVHNQRLGPYTSWPLNAVSAGSGLSHLGAQVSFSGSLIENLNTLAGAGVNGGQWSNWMSSYRTGANMQTSLGNPRLDMVAFGYHHPLLPLLDDEDIRMQIRLHKHVHGPTWIEPYSSGMFPPETAFSERIIPSLVAEGIEWVLVDNIHFDRACVGYPHTNSSNLYAPNAADQVNPNPATNGGAWVQLNNLWAPSQVSAPFGYQPHRAQYVDPETGAITSMVVVPAARYEGNEDGRGGYGAFLYDQVMDQYLAYNTDPAHPMFVVLHHDGDNFGGGSESYYHHNFQNMVNWASGDPDYEVSTIQDYLDRFPPHALDVIHVEDGAWAGADNGDPEFKKWLGDPGANGVSPDINSWAVLTAAKNRVFTAEAAAPAVSMQNVLNGSGSSTERAWHYLLVSEASDYWYWDGSSEPWDGNVTRGCNQAVQHADVVLAGLGGEAVGPTVFLPQREPYNPGGFEWAATPEPSDFEVWTLVADVSGVSSVTLKWRLDVDGVNPIASTDNELYAGGPEVGAWQSVSMTPSNVPAPPSVPAATYRAQRYSAMITDQTDVLIDYYVEAVDGAGNIKKSPIQHVYVGTSTTGGGNHGVTIDPEPAIAGNTVQITYVADGGPLAGASTVLAHYGFNGWDPVVSPDPAMTFDPAAADGEGAWVIDVALPSNAWQLDVVFNDGGGVWDNNNGQDWHFAVDGAVTPGFAMNGLLDASATPIASSAGLTLHAAVEAGTLYVAVDDAGEGNDHFVYVASPPGGMAPANWAKSGQIAQWAAYLADENDNDYESWFDAASGAAATGANGGVLEGTLDLAAEFGAVPSSVWLAVGVYPSQDGAGLVGQVPSSVDFDGNIDAFEYIEVELCSIEVGGAGCCAADLDGSGDVDVADLLAFLSDWFVGNADLDASGSTDVGDLLLYLGLWFTGCP